ncbi:MAG: hypothetical protein O6945_12385 [Gammaproteobacteria bacterium]|nr:hypothetical protein [Gammaproteobacteria bacterium]
MTQTTLRLTIFQIEKLKNIVDLGSVSPYKVSTFVGNSLGSTGTVIDSSNQEAANEDFWLTQPAPSTSWLQRFKSSFAWHGKGTGVSR